MASIQDIHALEQRIYDVVDDYIREAYLPDNGVHRSNMEDGHIQ